MNQIITSGIVLSRTNYEEADRIITILTTDQGKIRVLARGVRKVKSKLAAGIELFSVSDISFIRGRGEVSTLTSSRLKTHFGNIVADIHRTTAAYDFLKIINKITEDNVGHEFFDLLRSTLESLNDLNIDLDLIKLWFDMQLLKITGHTPNLETTTDSKKLSHKNNYNFDLSKMSFSPQPNGSYQANHIKLLRLVNNNSPAKLQKIKDMTEQVKVCCRLSASMRKNTLHL